MNGWQVGLGLGVNIPPGQSKMGCSSPQACVPQILGLVRTEKALGPGQPGWLDHEPRV